MILPKFNQLIVVCVVAAINHCYADSFTVFATREGLVGKKTASGMIIQKDSVFVALPSRSALGKLVKITYCDKSVVCRVSDVGPWSTKDCYWGTRTRPLSESGLRIPVILQNKYGKPKNKAGIDLSDGLWDKLGIKRDNGIVLVTWEFVTND